MIVPTLQHTLHDDRGRLLPDSVVNSRSLLGSPSPVSESKTARRIARLSLSGVLVGLITSVVGCSEEEVLVEEFLPSVSVTRVVSLDLDEEIRASGDLMARFHTMVAAEVAGRVSELLIGEGGSADVGAVVLEIDPARRELDVAAARARLAQARANLRRQKSQTERIRELRSRNVSSDEQLEQAETAYELALSAVRAEEAATGVAQRELSDSSVAAPFAGLIAKRSVELGQFVQMGTELFELVSLSPLEAVFSLTELDTQRVRVGQVVGVQVAAFPGEVFEGTVSFVAPTVDPATRTLRIKAEIENSDGRLRPGLFARVSLGVARRENILMVPQESVLQRAAGSSVYRVVADNRVERVSVETGASRDGLVEVRGDLKEGDRIVRRGHGGLSNGMEVVVRDDAGAPVANSELDTSAIDSAAAAAAALQTGADS